MGKVPATAMQPSPRQQTKEAKLRKLLQPVKVVHISNPMRVTTSAAKFRGLVQRLTGRHSNVADMVFDHSSVFLDAEPELQQQSYVLSSSLQPAASSGVDNYYGGATATERQGLDPYELGVLDPQALGVHAAGGFWRQFGA